MTNSREHPQDESDPRPLGGAVSEPSGEDGADGMAGPVYPPPETEPDASGTAGAG